MASSASSSSSSEALYGGLEGGATNTHLVIVNGAGQVLGRAKGQGSNAWLEGVDAIADMIVGLGAEARRAAGVADSVKLVSLGMCMSGFAQKEVQDALKARLREVAPTLSDHYVIVNDSVGSAFTVSANGAFVIISGTGSIGQVVTEDLDERVGGWGHLLGDEGSAYNIATAAVRLMIRTDEGVATGLPDASTCKSIVLKYFEAENYDDLVPIFYSAFDKSRVANLTRLLAEAANNGDAFCKAMFERAGRHLGRMMRTLMPVAPRRPDGSVDVLAVGSVWKSLQLLQGGIMAELACPVPPTRKRFPDKEEGMPSEVRLVRLQDTSAVGAAALAAKRCGKLVSLNYDELVRPLGTLRVADAAAAGTAFTSTTSTTTSTAYSSSKESRSRKMWWTSERAAWACVGIAAGIVIGALTATRRS